MSNYPSYKLGIVQRLAVSLEKLELQFRFLCLGKVTKKMIFYSNNEIFYLQKSKQSGRKISFCSISGFERVGAGYL